LARYEISLKPARFHLQTEQVARHQRYQAKKVQKHMNICFGKTIPRRGLIQSFRGGINWVRDVSRTILRHIIGAGIELEDLGSFPQDEECGVGPDFPKDRKNTWTLKHGFFATMGGYGLHIPPLPAGIRFFPQVDQEEYMSLVVKAYDFFPLFPKAWTTYPISLRPISTCAARDRGLPSHLSVPKHCGSV
jgi:hypothetical protein